MSALGQTLIAPPPPDVLFYPFADGGLLFREGRRRVWVLNPASAYVWCALDRAVDAADLSRRYARAFSVGRARALDDVAGALAGFRREGLLGETMAADPAAENGSWDLEVDGPPLGSRAKENWPFRRSFRLASHALELCCQDRSLGHAFGAIMEHLRVDCGEHPDTRLAVVAGALERTWDIYVDGRGWVAGVSPEGVLPYLVTLTFVRFSEALKDRLLFHAAVLDKKGRTVVLPGEAGSGKTTLAAALVARSGFSFYSDELAVVDVATLTVIPFPLPMSIKPGSLPVLARDYPGLSAVSVHPRSDGKEVRYLLLPRESLPSAGTAGKVHCIVFPSYLAGVTGRLNLLEKGHAMQRLVRTGSSNRDMTGADVRAMIALVEKVPCYELVFSELGDALEGVEKLVIG